MENSSKFFEICKRSTKHVQFLKCSTIITHFIWYKLAINKILHYFRIAKFIWIFLAPVCGDGEVTVWKDRAGFLNYGNKRILVFYEIYDDDTILQTLNAIDSSLDFKIVLNFTSPSELY